MNIRDIGPAMATMVSNVTTIVPRFFSGTKDDVVLATYSDVDEVSKWIKREQYANFLGMQVPVPPGFNAFVFDHIKQLEDVWKVLEGVVDGVLKPVNHELAGLANAPAMLTVPVAFRMSGFKYPLSNVNPDDLVSKLSKNYIASAIDQRAFEKTYRSAGELESTFHRAKALRDSISKSMRNDTLNLVESIAGSCEIISEADVNPNVSKELVKLVDMCDAWVQLLGLFMRQIDEVTNCINATTDQIKTLAKKDKA